MSGINRNPLGLLDFLQTQSGGRNPDFLQESVRPTIDIEQFYWSDRMFGAREPISMASGQLEFIEVPEGEVWKILTMGFTVNVVATARFKATFLIERLEPLGLNGLVVGSVEAVNDTAGTTGDIGAAIQLPVPFIVRSGQRLVIRCDGENDAGPAAGFFDCLVVKLASVGE
jgi:hypothetical protein